MTRLRYAVQPRIEKRVAGELPHVDLADVESGGTACWSPREAVERETEALLARPGDILLGKLRPYLRKGFVADRELTCSTEFLVLRPEHGWNPRFLLYVLLSAEFTAFAEMTVEGAKMPRTSWESMRDFLLPQLPPVGLQSSIVDFLDRECARIADLASELGRACEVALTALQDELRRLVLEGDYPFVPLKYYATTGTGHTPSRDRPEY